MTNDYSQEHAIWLTDPKPTPSPSPRTFAYITVYLEDMSCLLNSARLASLS